MLRTPRHAEQMTMRRTSLDMPRWLERLCEQTLASPLGKTAK